MLVVPATSHAVTGSLDKPCYTHLVDRGQDPTTEQVTEPITVTLAGGSPGGTFQVIASPKGGPSGGSGSITGTFDAAGNAAAQLTNTYPPKTTVEPSKGQTIDIAVTDYTAGVTAQPIGSVKITTLALAVSPKPRNPRKQRTVRVSGTAFAGHQLYGFVTSRNGKHVLDRFRLGTGNVCGYAKRKAVVAPSPFRYGAFRLYINAGTTLDRDRALGSRFRIKRSLL
jgi:hypothetical protein